MKYLLILSVFLSFSHAAEVVDFKCTSLDASYISKLNATGSLELDLEATEYQPSKAWLEASLTTAGFEPTVFTVNEVELVGKSRLIVGQTKYPYYHVQLRPLEEGSEIALVNLAIGFPHPMSSYIRLKTGHEFRGKCELK